MSTRPKTAQPLAGDEIDPRREWIYQNRDRLIRQALEGYRTSRRGALLIHPQVVGGRSTSVIEVGYLSDRAAQASGRGWPDQKTAEMVRSYDPASELVILMLHLNGSAISYRIHFAKAAITWVTSA